MTSVNVYKLLVEYSEFREVLIAARAMRGTLHTREIGKFPSLLECLKDRQEWPRLCISPYSTESICSEMLSRIAAHLVFDDGEIDGE